MHKEDPLQPTATFDNVQVTSKAHFLEEVFGHKRATRKHCKSDYDFIYSKLKSKDARGLTPKENIFCGACEGIPFFFAFLASV